MVESNIKLPFITLSKDLIDLTSEQLRLLYLLKVWESGINTDDSFYKYLFDLGYETQTFTAIMNSLIDIGIVKYDEDTRTIEVLV